MSNFNMEYVRGILFAKACEIGGEMFTELMYEEVAKLTPDAVEAKMYTFITTMLGSSLADERGEKFKKFSSLMKAITIIKAYEEEHNGKECNQQTSSGED